MEEAIKQIINAGFTIYGKDGTNIQLNGKEYIFQNAYRGCQFSEDADEIINNFINAQNN